MWKVHLFCSTSSLKFLIHLSKILILINNLQMSDWDRFAAEEYELLVAEESGADGPDDL